MTAAKLSTHSLRDLALIADGERGAIIAPDGNIAWLCAPRWESPAIFADLLGGGGVYAVRPGTPSIWGGSYEPGSLIFRSHWTGRSDALELRDALALPSNADSLTLLRRIEAVDGDTSVEIELDLRTDYGRHRSRDIRRDDAGLWHGRTADGIRWRWAGAPEAQLDSHGVLRMECRLRSGERRDLVLEIGTRLPDEPLRADVAWPATEDAWRARVPALDDSIAPRDARHAYAVLCGFTSHGNGMVAAATTSLPENIGGDRDYDYRYTWIRDQCYAGMADAAAGGTSLLQPALDFVTARLLEDGPALKPVYTTYGGAMLDEQELPLPGYPGSLTVIGNRARRQFQLDVFGDSLLLLAAGERLGLLHSDRGSGPSRASSASRACDRWRRRTDPPKPPVTSSSRTASWRRPRSAVCIPTATGDSIPTRTARMPRCCCRPCAAPCRQTIRAPSPRCSGCSATSPKTGTRTDSGTTTGPSARPRARSCCAGSWCRSRTTPSATGSRRSAGSSATAPPPAHRGCSPRSSTCSSGSSAATCLRRSCTR